jgi:hypothetical protein
VNVGRVAAPRRLRARPLGRRTRALLVALEGFVGAGALYGGVELVRDAEGFGMELSWLEGTPFTTYTIPGLVLLVVIGGGMLGAALTALLGSDRAGSAALCMGVALLVFLAAETALIGYQGSRQILLLAVTGLPALVLVAVGWLSLAGRLVRSSEATR